MNNKKTAIIGFGRFGKLLAELLMPNTNIHIISSREIDDERFSQIDYKDLVDIDWVIIATPISGLQKVLTEIKPFLKKGAIVMDVCSVKVNPCKWMEEILPQNVEIIGSHPMFGPDSASKGKLNDLQMVFCPLRISEDKYKKIKSIFGGMDLNIIETTPEDHDKQNAISLALVHFMGRGLAQIDIDHQKITTIGFKRLLQLRDNVTNDTMELFKDVNNFNPYAKEIRKKYIESLQKIDSMLD